MTHYQIFSSLENGLRELYTRGQLSEYWWVIPPRSDLHAKQKYMLALSKQRLVRHTKKCDTADSTASNSFFYSDFLWVVYKLSLEVPAKYRPSSSSNLKVKRRVRSISDLTIETRCDYYLLAQLSRQLSHTSVDMVHCSTDAYTLSTSPGVLNLRSFI